MPVEFVNAISTSDLSRRGESFFGSLDPAWLRRYARTIEEFGFDHTLVPYGSSGFDQYVVAAAVLAATERLNTVVAVRPNTAFPTVAAQALATLDQLGGGRTLVHIISGGSDEEQRRQGDYLDKAARYARSEEFIRILRDVWTTTEPFSHEGAHYRFEGFGPGFRAHEGRSIPVSLGGSSDHAYETGGRVADIFALWGEPLAETAEQIERVTAVARAAGRTDPLRFWVTFRPVVAETDALAWQKAERIAETFAAAPTTPQRLLATNVGSARLRDIAARAERHDDALFIPKATAGNGGASSLIVGSPETIADAIVRYVELGADIVSLPTLGVIGDAVDAGRHIIPLVREKLAAREARAAASAA